jgi:hypothetical protein
VFPLFKCVGVQVLQDQFGSSIHTALIIKPDNFWQKQRTNLGSQKYKFEVNSSYEYCETVQYLGVGTTHRVDILLGFFSSRPNWDPPPPYPQGIVFPLLWYRKGGTHSLAGERGGVPIPMREQALWYSRYTCMCTLWAYLTTGRRSINELR